MQRWEYLQHDEPWPKIAGEMVDLPKRWDALEITLNGWELVSTVRTPSGTITSLFKRPYEEKRTGVSAPLSDQRTGVWAGASDQQTGVSANPPDQRAGVPALASVSGDKKRKGGRA